GERIRFEGEHRRKDGTVFPVEVIASVVEFGGHKYILALDRDITESKTAKKLSDALNQINTAITSTLDVSEIMQRVVSESAQALGSGTAGIALREEGYWVTKYVHGLPNLAVGSKIAEDEAVITQIAIETGKPVSIDDIYADKRVDQELMEKHGICAFMVVPIMLRGEAIGALSFSYYRAVTFTDEQIDFASKLGTSVSLALENARLYESEKEVADVLQEALLVMPEEIEGTDFSYLYRSATRTARVGGDFYDIFELEHGKVGIVIGDVSGKGIEAATLTALIKSTIRAHAYEDKSPAVVIAKTNEAVKRGANLAVFITVVFGVLDVESGEFTYCSAGHPRAVIKRKTGEVVFLETSSPVIGAFLGVCFLDDKATLARGDILVLYTDGVVEARHDSSFYGEEGIVEFFKNLKPIPTKEVPQAIYGDVTKFASGKLSDDVAILAISLDERDV
ncbi:MAG TPA: SpoIIE family protein phosphatase, partial [Anaerolineae bacterium]|nr:SpoIIE family protein phosphatase [Anaerolineae bacterium]